ncbi:hypothetical protein E2C01_043227 [Portunus trituberculatus]|uniref:Uncharacterized protein n=1 Tax=Portunus trituberculatus TaxID=210409 RepID=A0A5B7FWZ4_PORTR|nr:hypothetical protein [Portunus trituberculatus]
MKQGREGGREGGRGHTARATHWPPVSSIAQGHSTTLVPQGIPELLSTTDDSLASAGSGATSPPLTGFD